MGNVRHTQFSEANAAVPLTCLAWCSVCMRTMLTLPLYRLRLHFGTSTNGIGTRF